MTATTVDVLVVGAGPTGLLVAGDLAAAGVSVAVVERRGEESNLTRAFAVNPRTLELLDARGLVDGLLATGARADVLRLFGNVELRLGQLPTRFPYLLITPQYHTERVLSDRFTALGGSVESGTEVVGLRQDVDGVDVNVRGRNGKPGVRRARYVVGADGIGSAVRGALGLPFPGRSAVRSVMLADVRMTEPPAELPAVNGVAAGFSFIVPFGDGFYRIIAWNRHNQQPDDAEVSLSEIRSITRTAMGSDFGMHDARWTSRFHSDERQVPRYRTGRVFLAGDAAHVHSPALGLGMNTGLQDAANLGWKLAATVQGWGVADLLDTYHTERHPVGRQVLRASGTVLRLALLEPSLLRAARDLAGAALTRIPPVMRRIEGLASGIAITYPAPRGSHRLVGSRVPDLRLVTEDGRPRRLHEVLRSGRFVLVTRTDPPAVPSDRVAVMRYAGPGAAELLVRPDGHVAWASDHPDPTGQAANLAGWFGSRSREGI